MVHLISVFSPLDVERIRPDMPLVVRFCQDEERSTCEEGIPIRRARARAQYSSCPVSGIGYTERRLRITRKYRPVFNPGEHTDEPIMSPILQVRYRQDLPCHYLENRTPLSTLLEI